MLKAVIFDMDGVLIDSEPLHAKATVNALAKLDVDITIEYCYGFIGSTTLHMLESMIKDFNIPHSVSKLLEVYQETKHNLVKEEGYKPIPYVKDLIINLHQHGIKLAIASSSSSREIEDVVRALGVKKYFSKLISGTTVPNPKPAPDVFQKAVTELGVSHTECIIIEDSYNGVCGGKAANIPVIGFLNQHSGNQNLSEASTLIEGFDEINYKFIDNVYTRAYNQPIIIAVTNRLIIRELTVNDIPTIYQIYQNPEVKKFISDIDEYLDIEIEKHKAYIKNVYNFYGYGLWGVFSNKTGELIGRCGVQTSIINGKTELELGYLLDYNHWGFGYAIECINAVLNYVFNELDIKRIVALIHPKNTRSVGVAKRIGMHKEGMSIKDGLEYELYTIEKNVSR